MTGVRPPQPSNFLLEGRSQSHTKETRTEVVRGLRRKRPPRSLQPRCLLALFPSLLLFFSPIHTRFGPLPPHLQLLGRRDTGEQRRSVGGVDNVRSIRFSDSRGILMINCPVWKTRVSGASPPFLLEDFYAPASRDLRPCPCARISQASPTG